MAAPSLAFGFGLPPERAIDWFNGKGYAIGWDWRAVAAITRGYAFSVAGVARADVLADIRAELERALAAGTTFDDFRRGLRERLTAAGWWGPQQVVRLDTGETKTVNLASPRRLATIYRTNLQSAYMAGRYQALSEMRKERPYWEYVAVMDERTRPAHAALNGKVFRADDPVWESIFPPNGYNCRCRVRALSETDVRERGIAVMSSEGRVSTYQVEGTNAAIDERVVLDLGGGVQFSPDVGFGRNPALDAPYPDLVMGDRLAVLGAARDEALRTIAAADPRLKAFGAWVDEVVSQGVSRGSSQVAGYLDAELVAYAAQRGAVARDWPIVLEDRLLVGPKSLRHGDAGDALTLAQWKALPQMLARARAVLWGSNGKLVFVFDDEGDPTRRVRIVVDIADLRRGGFVANAIDSVSTVLAAALRDANYYTLIRGLV